MSLKRLLLPSLCVIAMGAPACSCGDDGGGDGDGDGDAGDDIDSAVNEPSQTGRIIMAATTFFNLPAPFDTLGEGLLQVVDVYPVADRPPFAFEEAPGSVFGCKVTELTPAQLATPPVNLGTLSFSITNGPAFPDCTFVDDVGYQCVGAAGTGGDIAAPATPNPPLLTLTNAAVTFGADQVGRKVRITGSAIAGNNGVFNVVGVMGANTIIYANPAYGAAVMGGAAPTAFDDPATAAAYQVVAGLGPAGQADPVPDDAHVVTTLAAGGNGTFTDFETDVDIGDSFTPDTATQGLLDNVPLDGSEFSLACDGAGGTCNTAMATVISIETTDGDVTGLPPFLLPPPVTKAVRLFCLQPAAGSVTIPAAASAFLMTSGATRVRTIMLRATPGNVNQPDGNLDNVAGHAIAGFTTP